MNTSARKFPEDITAAVISWMELRDQGKFNGAKEDEFLAWLDADPRHLEAFEEFDKIWDGLGGLNQPELGAAVPIAAKSATPARDEASPVRRGVRPAVWATALAAAVAIGFFLFPRLDSPLPEPLRFASTQVGEAKTLHLPDGSLVRLEPETRVSIDYSISERRLRLAQGSAHFAVAKDKARPFIVTAGAVSVRAVGTAFDVRLGSATVEVQVTEGKVRVDDTTSGISLLPKDTPVNLLFDVPVLGAGEKVVIPTNLAILEPAREVLALAPVVSPAPSDAEILEFDGTPLEQVVAEFNRHNRHQLVLADEKLRDQLFTGKFRADGYEGLTRLLRNSFSIQVEEHGGKTLLRAAPLGEAAPSR